MFVHVLEGGSVRLKREEIMGQKDVTYIDPVSYLPDPPWRVHLEHTLTLGTRFQSVTIEIRESGLKNQVCELHQNGK